MARDWLKGVSNYYDVIVIGSGLAGLTGANYLAKNGHSVLLLEHHYQYGGMYSSVPVATTVTVALVKFNCVGSIE